MVRDWTIRRKPRKRGILRDDTPSIQFEKELAVAMELSPEWVVGFVDGEGNFTIGVRRSPTVKIGFQVIPEFRVVQHMRDIDILHALKRFFGFGRVCRNHDDRWEYRVRRLEQVREIARFFSEHQLKTKKRIDARKFAEVLRLMDEGRHLTDPGLKEIVKLAASMSTGNRLRLRDTLEGDEDRVQSCMKVQE